MTNQSLYTQIYGKLRNYTVNLEPVAFKVLINLQISTNVSFHCCLLC